MATVERTPGCPCPYCKPDVPPAVESLTKDDLWTMYAYHGPSEDVKVCECHGRGWLYNGDAQHKAYCLCPKGEAFKAAGGLDQPKLEKRNDLTPQEQLVERVVADVAEVVASQASHDK